MAAFIDTFLATFSTVFASVNANASFLLSIILVLWGIHLVNALSGYRLKRLGIYPRRAYGLPGIFFAPFLHASIQHLFLNSIPLLVLGALVLVSGQAVFLQISLLIILVNGLVIWLVGRPGCHLGASALVLGYWGFLLFNAYEKRSFIAVFLALLCLYYFGSLIYSLFPQEERVSWEGHVAGFLSGVFASYFLAHLYVY